jgi:hypothetical protein
VRVGAAVKLTMNLRTSNCMKRFTECIALVTALFLFTSALPLVPLRAYAHSVVAAIYIYVYYILADPL